MKNVMLKIGGLVVIGMLCTLVPASLYAGCVDSSWPAVCGDCSLDGSVKITPSTLNLSNSSQSAVIMAHISGDNLDALLAAHNNGNPFQITCINGIGLTAPIAPIPGMASIDDDVLNIGFYRHNLISALAGASGSAKITVAQTGAGSVVTIGGITIPLNGSTTIPDVDLTVATNLNLGEPSTGVTIELTLVEAISGSTLCTLYSDVFSPVSILLNISKCSGISLTSVDLILTVYGTGTGDVTFTGVSLSGGSTGVGLGGTDTIRLK